MAYYEDLKIDQGSDIAVELHLINQDRTTKDLTNYAVEAKLSPSYYSSDSDRIPFNAIIADPATDGVITLELTNAVTDSLNPKKRYVYDVEISYLDSDNNSIVERVLEGMITVTPSVTK